MNSVINILLAGLGITLIFGPSISFLLCLVFRFKKQKDQVRVRILSSLRIVTTSLFGCVLFALISRALETSSSSNILISIGTVSGYAYYVFCALNVVLFPLLVIAYYSINRVHKQNKTTEPNQGVWMSLEPETQTVLSRTRRYSERPCLSRIMLRAAYSAPSTVVAELKRSAKLRLFRNW